MVKRSLACLAALVLLLGGYALGEPLYYESPENGIAFGLPEGWDIQSGDFPVFYALDGSGQAVLYHEGRPIPQEDFFPQALATAVERLGAESEDALETLFFTQVQGEDGKWYALASFGCVIEEVPHILSFYYFTRPDNTLAELMAVSVNNEMGAVTRNWLDGIVQSHVPADVMARIMQQIGQ